jgi:hypothetical protein
MLEAFALSLGIAALGSAITFLGIFGQEKNVVEETGGCLVALGVAGIGACFAVALIGGAIYRMTQ